MPKDAIQSQFEIGDIVDIPCVVTGIGGTPAEPTLTLTTKYKGFAGTTDDISTVDTKQVIKDK
jgi:hypothetical protein